MQFSYFWNAFQDKDHDGIDDRIDLDPQHPEDVDGFQDDDGAPDYDNDMDGIPDLLDKAPNQPEDIDGYQDDDGVPDPDNDHDLVPDVRDKCPDTPEDFDQFEDEDGCPDYDNDGDGIPDSLDKCPNWPEDFNNYQDDDGCPDKKPEVGSIKIGDKIVTHEVRFISGTQAIKPESLPIIDKIYQMLKQYPEYHLEIRVHTDNLGAPHVNLQISKMRANAIRTYLIERGIDPSRLRAVGFGDMYPIGDNSTAEGRAENRRIEFVRIK